MKKMMGIGSVSLLGLAALVLRWQLYRAAVDEKGLLPRMHPLSIALLMLTAAALLLIYITVRKQEEAAVFADRSPRSIPAALGHAVMAGIILTTVLADGPQTSGYLTTVWEYLGMAAFPCLVLAGTDRLRGKKSFFLLHVMPCLFFVVHIVSHYQSWSGDPQMQDYVFALLGAMALMFFGFYTAAMEAGCGSRRMRLGMGLAAACLCMAELGHSGAPMLYLAGTVWVLTDLGCRKLREE
jgi:hypothetical protein